MANIHFLDVTNRDGVQTARTGLSKFGKTMVNFYLGRLGVAPSEIGFPFLYHEVPSVRAAKGGGAATVGVNAEDGSRTDDGFLLEFALAARDAGADRIRYCDTIGGDTPGRIRDRFATLASAVGIPVETHCHNDLGMAVANSVSGALGDLDAGQDAWINTCVNGIGERSGNADLLSCILAVEHGFGLPAEANVGDAIDLTWARRFGWWASHAFGQPLPNNQPGIGPNAFAHESGIHADGALKDHANYELYDEAALGPWPADWHARRGRVVLTGEYGGKAGFRHVMDGLGIEVTDEDTTFRLVQLCNAATGRPLTDDELRLIAAYPAELSLLYPGYLTTSRSAL